MSLPVFAAAAALALLLVGCAALAVRARQHGRRSRQGALSVPERAPQETSGPASTTETAAGAPPTEVDEAPSPEQVVPNGTAAASLEPTLTPVREPAGAESGDSGLAAKSDASEYTRYETIAGPLVAPPAAEPHAPAASPEPAAQSPGPTATGGLEAGAPAEIQYVPADEPAGPGAPDPTPHAEGDTTELPPKELTAPAQSTLTGAASALAEAAAVPAHEAVAPPGDVIAPVEEPSPVTPGGSDQDAGEDLTGPVAPDAEPETPGGEPVEILPGVPPPARRYRPVAPSSRRLRREPSGTAQEADADRPLPVCVRLLFERAGFCKVSLLAKRGSGLPEEIPIEGTGSPGKLAALQEDWYQDVLLEELGQALQTGISWQSRAGCGEHVRWALSGREIVVLAPHEDLSGFVSCTRLAIGDEHVVLCTQSQRAAALGAIALAGSPQPVELGPGMGVPDGWTGLRGVVPRNAVTPSIGGEILDVLRPLAEAEIALDGGIRLSRSSWLAGHPPQIHVRGDAAAAGTLYIDDHAASPDANGIYRVPGWDSPRTHLVRCTSGTRTYEIAAGKEAWEAWDAYTWSTGGMDSGNVSKPSICGALVLPPRSQRYGQRMLSVPSRNPVLVGARPGDIYTSERRSDVRTDELAAFAPFDAVWALPDDAFHCSRQSRVLSMRVTAPVPPPARIPASETRRLLAWCSAILNASRKRLALQPDDQAIRKLWDEYRHVARALRKRLK